MGTVAKKTTIIPVGEIQGVEIMFGRQMKFDVSNVPGKFKPFFEKTRKDTFDSLKIKGIYESFPIAETTDDFVRLENGEIFESGMLAKAFRNSAELVVYVVSVSGYEELDEAEENMVAKLFLDSWGTSVVECGSLFLKKRIGEELLGQNIYSTFSFSPGQHNIAMQLQTTVFRILEPEEIGVTLNDHYLMHPKKSVSGIFGIGPHKDEEGMRPCDFCSLRETCPSAYAGDEFGDN
jgi:Methionine synthase I, cobalamin-binding domain